MENQQKYDNKCYKDELIKTKIIFIQFNFNNFFLFVFVELIVNIN